MSDLSLVQAASPLFGRAGRADQSREYQNGKQEVLLLLCLELPESWCPVSRGDG